MRILITGSCGFIGSHLVNYLLDNSDWEIICVDKLSYSTKGWKRLKDSRSYYNPRVLCFTWDLEKPFSEGIITEIGDINIIIHMAAETHVDTSIRDPIGTIHNNVMSTVYLLEYARTLKNLQLFQQFSTDEVYGVCPKNYAFKETDVHTPTNPYSASKSSAEQICIAYQNTFKIPIIITNLMNVFGEMQHVEKFIPMTIKKVLNNETVIIHTEKDGVTSGTRFYIHAKNVAEAVVFILRNGKAGERYNIPGSCEVSNLELAQKIAYIMNRELNYELIAIHDARPFHDSRYCLDGTKLATLGWTPPNDFDQKLRETVEWTLNHPEWLKP
jgi:dTDP-glucose 4,6-dehydratase